MLLNLLKKFIQEDPLKEEIVLEDQGISFIDTNSMEIMSRLKNLKSINLADNHISKLPANMSMLCNLQEINLNGNPLEDIQAATDALQTIGGNLKTVHINLYEEDQVDYMLRNLEWLEVLNGLKVERDALFNQEESSSDDENEQDGQGEKEARVDSPDRKSYCSPLKKQLSEVEEKPEQESARRLMQIEPILELSVENSTNVGCRSQLELITKQSASFGAGGTRSQDQLTEVHPYRNKVTPAGATEHSPKHYSSAHLSAATKEDERPTETVSSLGKHQSCQLLQHNGEFQQPNMFSLNPDFTSAPQHQSVDESEGNVAQPPEYHDKLEKGNGQETVPPTTAKLAMNEGPALNSAGQPTVSEDCSNFKHRATERDRGRDRSPGDLGLDVHRLARDQLHEQRQPVTSRPVSIMVSERLQSAVVVETTSRRSNGDGPGEHVGTSMEMDCADQMGSMHVSVEQQLRNSNSRNSGRKQKEGYNFHQTNAPQTQSKSSLRYSNKEMEATSTETVFKDPGAAHRVGQEEQFATAHSAMIKRNHYEVYDASKGNTDALQSSIGSVAHQTANGRYDDAHGSQMITAHIGQGGAQFMTEEREGLYAAKTHSGGHETGLSGHITRMNQSLASQNNFQKMYDLGLEQQTHAEAGRQSTEPLNVRSNLQQLSLLTSQDQAYSHKIQPQPGHSSHTTTIDRSFSQNIKDTQQDHNASLMLTESRNHAGQAQPRQNPGTVNIVLERRLDEREPIQPRGWSENGPAPPGSGLGGIYPHSRELVPATYSNTLKDYDALQNDPALIRQRTASPVEATTYNRAASSLREEERLQPEGATRGSAEDRPRLMVPASHQNTQLVNNFTAQPLERDTQYQQQLESKFSASMKSHEDVVRISSSKAMNMPLSHTALEDKQRVDLPQRAFTAHRDTVQMAKPPSPRTFDRMPCSTRPKRLLDAIAPVESVLMEDLTTPPFQGQQPSQRSHQKTMNSVETNILKDCLQSKIEPIELLPELSTDELELNSADLEQIAIVYDKIRSIYKQFVIQKFLLDKQEQGHKVEELLKSATELSQEEDQRLAQEFDTKLTEIMQELNRKQQELIALENEGKQLNKQNRGQTERESMDGEDQSDFEDDLGQRLLQENVERAMRSLILQQKYNLIQLCFKKTMQFLQEISEEHGQAELAQKESHVEGRQKITLWPYVEALQSVLVNLQQFQVQIQLKHFRLAEQDIVRLLPQRGGLFRQLLDDRLHQKNDLQEALAQNELKDIELREMRVKLQQKDQELSKLSQKLGQYGSAQQPGASLHQDGAFMTTAPQAHLSGPTQHSSVHESQRASQNAPPRQIAEECMGSVQADFNLERNEQLPRHYDFGMFSNQKEAYQQLQGLHSEQQDEQVPVQSAQAAIHGAKNSNKKQKTKKTSISSRSAYLNRSRGGHVPTFSHQYEVQHNTNGSAYSSEFVVTQNLSPGPGSQADTTAANIADPRLNSLPKAILKSKQNQHQGRSIRPAGLSNQPHAKVLPLKQLKDIIGDIYAQKMKYDKKCHEAQLPVETMEQFMYNYLNQKYGLKTLIVEWASTIITGIKCYVQDDHEVTLFAKILKNECDEEFRFVQMHVRQTLGYLLKQVMRERYPTKSQQQISQECEAIQNSHIDEWQWKKILNRMYERSDAALLSERFHDILENRKRAMVVLATETSTSTLSKAAAGPQAETFRMQRGASRDDVKGIGYYMQKKMQIHQELAGSESKTSLKPQPRQKSRTRLSREEQHNRKKQAEAGQKILYQQEFEKVILDFQLQEHERFLHEFNKLFREVDEDQNGIIDEDEFRALVLNMGVVVQNHDSPDNDIEALLRIVDPHNNQQVTYSQVVQLLSNQLVPQQNSFDRRNELGIHWPSMAQPSLFAGPSSSTNDQYTAGGSSVGSNGGHALRDNFNNDISSIQVYVQRSELPADEPAHDQRSQEQDHNEAQRQGGHSERDNEGYENQGHSYLVSAPVPAQVNNSANNSEQLMHQLLQEPASASAAFQRDPKQNDRFIPILEKFYKHNYSDAADEIAPISENGQQQFVIQQDLDSEASTPYEYNTQSIHGKRNTMTNEFQPPEQPLFQS